MRTSVTAQAGKAAEQRMIAKLNPRERMLLALHLGHRSSLLIDRLKKAAIKK